MATLSAAGSHESLSDDDEGSESTLIEDEIMLGYCVFVRIPQMEEVVQSSTFDLLG